MELSICWSKHLISDRVYFEIDLIKDDDEGNWKSAIGWKSCPFQCFFLALQIPKDLKFSSNIVGCRWRWPNWNAGQKNKSLEILITFHHQQRPVNGCCSMCPRENCLPMNLVGLACKWSDMVWFEFVPTQKPGLVCFPYGHNEEWCSIVSTISGPLFEMLIMVFKAIAARSWSNNG